MSENPYPSYSPGLQGVVGGLTAISEIVSSESRLTYRGINVHDLAENGSFEETSFLLIHGRLPNQADLDAYKARLDSARTLPDAVIQALRLVPEGTHPMDTLRMAYALLTGFDADYENHDHDANVRKAERMLAMAPTIVAAAHRISHGQEPVAPKSGVGHAANFLYMLHGEEADDYTAMVMDASLTLYAEHTYNASTFACRVTVATLSDLYSGIVTGIGTLKGPLHGGANEEAMKMLLEIGSPENAEPWLREALAGKKKIMGFGHREYKLRDSRAIYLTEVAKEIGRRKGNTTYGDIADILEGIMAKEKNIHPNVDFPAAYAYYLLGIPIELYTPIFVIARVSGWSAHAIEQLDDNRLIRPTCIYTGPSNVPFTPIAERA